MKLEKILITFLIVLVLLLVLRKRSGYTPATLVAGGLNVNFMTLGKDVNWAGFSTPKDYVPGTTADGTATFDSLNTTAWTNGYKGWRKDITTNTVWWLKRTIASGDMVVNTDAFTTVPIGGFVYDVPRVVVCNRSNQDPRLGTDCTFTKTLGSTCSQTACGTTGYYTDTWTGTEATYGGKSCASIGTPADDTSRTCTNSPCPVNCVWTKTNGTACSETACGKTGYYTDTWSKTPEQFGGTCASSPADDTSRACSTPACPVPCVWSLYQGTTCSKGTCGTQGTYNDYWYISTPASNGGTCASTPAVTTRTCTRAACPTTAALNGTCLNKNSSTSNFIGSTWKQNDYSNPRWVAGQGCTYDWSTKDCLRSGYTTSCCCTQSKGTVIDNTLATITCPLAYPDKTGSIGTNADCRNSNYQTS